MKNDLCELRNFISDNLIRTQENNYTLNVVLTPQQKALLLFSLDKQITS